MVITARPSLGMAGPGLRRKGTKASRILIWAMVSSWGLVLRTCSSINSGFTSVRSNTRDSIGAAGWTFSPPEARKAAMTPARSTKGRANRAAGRSQGPRRSASVALPMLFLHFEDAGPAQLGELGLVSVEHEAPGVAVAELHDAALGLHLGDGVGELRGLQTGPGGVVIEEVGVDVKRVALVELQQVQEIDAHQGVLLDLDRVAIVPEGDEVHVVEVVLVVEIDVVAGHDHDHLLVGLGPAGFGIDDDRPVQAAADVAGQRHDVGGVGRAPRGLRGSLQG